MQHIQAYFSDGTCRAIWAKPYARVHRQHNHMPVRGSQVIAITVGPRAGLFHVDFSPLADLTEDDRYRICLTATFELHEEAVSAERAWLLRNWVLGTPDFLEEP